MEHDPYSRLRFRRQFIYGPKVDQFSTWPHHLMPNGYEVAVHPDLQFTRADHEGDSLILLGYVFDIDHPELDNQQVLDNLLINSKSKSQFLEKLDQLSGRYVLFVFLNEEQFVLMDAAGMRQVFHYQRPDNSIWLCSQPGILQNLFDLHYSKDAESFLASPTILASREPWWPGTSTPFEEVRHLLPNHLLDLRTGEVKRYWPREPITRYKMRAGAEKATSILRKIMIAANMRFDLAMALTGGYDSRIVFAACREIVKDLHVYSMIYHKLSDTSSEITIAKDLAKFAGVPHEVIRCNQPMTEDFKALYEHNLEKSYQSYGHIVYGRFLNLDENKVVVKSVVNEIARCFYYRTGVYPYQITTDLLCRISKLGTHPFTYRYFSEWLEDAKPVEKLGYKILDFFYWENRNANWQAMSQLEFDLANDEFTPFNHREMLSIMLGVDHRRRCMPKNEFQREMVRCSWRELDDFPYNPGAKVIKKPFYEGPWMTLARWVKYNLIKRNNNELDR